MTIIVALIFVAAILLAPVFLNVNLFFDAEKRKCCFSLYILHFIKIYGGYATLNKRGLIFHLTRHKAIFMPFAEILDTRKKFEITRGFRLYAYSHVCEIGSAEDTGIALMACSLIRLATCIGAGYAIHRKHCKSFKGDVVLYPERKCFKISLRLILLFNLFLLLMALAKLILSKIVEKSEDGKIGQKG